MKVIRFTTVAKTVAKKTIGLAHMHFAPSGASCVFVHTDSAPLNDSCGSVHTGCKRSIGHSDTHAHTHTHTCTHARARTHARAHTRTRTRTHTHHTERFPRGFGAEILPYSGLLITTLGYEPGVTNMATRQQAKILNFRHPPYPPNSKLSLTVQDTLVHDKCFSAQVMFNIVLGEGGAMRTESEVSYFAC